MSNSKRQSFAKNFIETFFRQIGVGVIGLISAVIIARVYGPVGNGIYAIAILLPQLLSTLLNLGIGPANVYFLGSNQVKPDIALRVSYRIFLRLNIIGLFIGFCLLYWQSEVLFPGIEQNLLYLGLPLFPLILLNGYILSIFHGLQEFKTYNRFLIVQPFLFFLTVVILYIVKSKSIETLVLVYLLTHFFTLILMLISIKKINKMPLEASIVSAYQKKAISYGWKSNLSNILAFVNYKADIFLVNFFMNPLSAGIYVIAVTLAEKLWLISSAVCTVLLPRLSELSSDEEKRKKLTPLVSRIVIAITLLAATVLALISQPFVLIIFGSQYIQSVMPLLVLLPGIVILAVAKVWANDIASRGRPEINTYISIITLISNLIGNLILIPAYGLLGAAMATTISYVICSLITLIVYMRLTNNKCIDILLLKISDIKLIINIVKKRSSAK
jgi:O-antigen/teichoic acid export membrane protein